MGKLWRKGLSSSKGWKFIEAPEKFSIAHFAIVRDAIREKDDESLGMATAWCHLHSTLTADSGSSSTITFTRVLARDGNMIEN